MKWEAVPMPAGAASPQVAEADGNRTRQGRDTLLNGFEDRGAHQDPDTSAVIVQQAAERQPVTPGMVRARARELASRQSQL
jgi:hypothetical protein